MHVAVHSAVLTNANHQFDVPRVRTAGNIVDGIRAFWSTRSLQPWRSRAARRTDEPTPRRSRSRRRSTLACKLDAGASPRAARPTRSPATRRQPNVHRPGDRTAGNRRQRERDVVVDTAGRPDDHGGPTGPTNDATPSSRSRAAGSPTSVTVRSRMPVLRRVHVAFTTAALATYHTFVVQVSDAAATHLGEPERFPSTTTPPPLCSTRASGAIGGQLLRHAVSLRPTRPPRLTCS